MRLLKSNRFWALALGLLLAVALMGSYLVLRGRDAATARIYQDGVLLEEINLLAVTAPYTLHIDGPHGGNTLGVEHRRIRILDAGCPDKTCVAHGWVQSPLLPAVCLPNRLVVEVTGLDASDFDAISK